MMEDTATLVGKVERVAVRGVGATEEGKVAKAAAEKAVKVATVVAKVAAAMEVVVMEGEATEGAAALTAAESVRVDHRSRRSRGHASTRRPWSLDPRPGRSRY